MEYYTDLGMPSEHNHTDPYTTDYEAPYVVPGQFEAEYEACTTVLVDGGDRFGVSAVAFDNYEELIWMGNQGGHVTSYYGPSMQKYTSFQVHESEEIRDILTHENGIFLLTKTSLRHQIRRGIPKYTHRSKHMTDMQCLYQASDTSILMGGHQDKLINFDIASMKETVISIPEEGCAVLRSGGGTIVACGSASGSVAIRDIRCPGKAEHYFSAHTASLSDLDMQGNLLITCGFTHSASGVADAEPYVVVWDVRRLRGGRGQRDAWSHPTTSPPLLLHFLPAFSGRAVAVAGDGNVALLHVNAPDDVENQSVFQVDTQNSLCTVMDVAASSQALVFGDQAGHLHLFSSQHNHEPFFNTHSRDTEFADLSAGPSFVSMADSTFRFSSVPLPTLGSGSEWLNDLPPEFFIKAHRKPKPLDPEVLKTMKMQGPIGYAPNPRAFRRNQMPYLEDTFDDLNSPRHDVKLYVQTVPKQYQKMEPRYSKQTPAEEVENKSGLPGLEPTIPNSYCNPMLQVLYYTPTVKATLLAHSCAREYCLSCELGFLFRMLDSSKGAACQAGNFLRAFRTVPEAAALGLILPDRLLDQRVDLVALIQSWNRFILHQMHYECLETRKKAQPAQRGSPMKAQRTKTRKGSPTTSPTVNGFNHHGDLEFLGPTTEFDGREELKAAVNGWPHNAGGDEDPPDPPLTCDDLDNHRQEAQEESKISELFAIGRLQMNRCLKCSKEEERQSVALACALQYPPPSTLKDAVAEPKGGFIQLLLASLSSRRSTPAWCENCKRFSPTLQRGRVVRLPPILAINCGGVTAHEKAYWSKGTQKENIPEGAKRGGSGKPCRYGLHCARPGCRFKHPDRPGSSMQSHSNSSNGSPTREPLCVLPNQLTIRLTAEGDIVVNDKSEHTPDAHRTENGTTNDKKKPSTDGIKNKLSPEAQGVYALSAAVVCVEDHPRHLVSYVRTAGEGSWHLINDLSIVPVPIEEVVQCSAWWKMPCVLFYTSSSVPPPPPRTDAAGS